MNKIVILSIAVFFIVFGIQTLGFDFTAGDHPYYTTYGGFGDGHDLAILILRPMKMLGDPALPIFVNFLFVFSVYFLLKSFIKYPEWAFVLAPITPLSTVYAQIMAIGLFNFMLGFYFRNRKRVAVIFLGLVFLTHYWTGLFVSGIFGAYLFFHNRPDKRILLSTMIVAGLFLLLLPQDIGFLTEISTNTADVARFFYLFSRGYSFFIFSLFGLYLLYKKHRDFFMINLMLLAIPIIIAFLLPTSGYWSWRLIYFMPLLALMSVLLSHLKT